MIQKNMNKIGLVSKKYVINYKHEPLNTTKLCYRTTIKPCTGRWSLCVSMDTGLICGLHCKKINNLDLKKPAKMK